MTTPLLRNADSTSNAQGKRMDAPRMRRRWKPAEFEKAAEAGIFGHEERLELINGDLFPVISPDPPHAVVAALIREQLHIPCVQGFTTRLRGPLMLGEDRPEPDVAIVRGVLRDYLHSHPTTAELVIEIPNTTLAFDRTTKQGLYARAGIPEYWILNLNERTLEVYRQPAPTEGHPLGHRYRNLLTCTETDTVAPLFAPGAEIRIADILP